MAKTNVSEWDSVATNNLDIDGINISNDCPPSYVNDAIREMMAQIKDWQMGVPAQPLVSNGSFTSNGTTNITGSFAMDGALGGNGQVLTSKGSTDTPTWETLGNMSVQNKNAVDITGGTITGTSINTVTVGTNASGQKTFSTENPSGGQNGDIWYKYI
jgi:hypothetical protein